jgi:glyoxylase-like metal-dependent hydrolase (beta-lactamase superfamily II)
MTQALNPIKERKFTSRFKEPALSYNRIIIFIGGIMQYQSVKLADNLWCIKDGFVQCYLIEGSEQALLFDCCASGGEEFKETIDALTGKPVRLLISHSDQDHTGAQQFFDTTSMHASEFNLYTSKGNDPARARSVWEGEVFDLGGVELEVILLPGHTPGSIALLDRKNRRLFAGDSMSDRWIYIFGAGRSLEAYIASVKKLEQLSSLFDTMYCCHGTMALGSEWVQKTRIAAGKLLAGELEPAEPPVQISAKSYSFDNVVFFR